jgi:hypothetical protein
MTRSAKRDHIRQARELLERHGDIELRFAGPRHPRRGRVHVGVPEDPDAERELVAWDDLSPDDQFDVALGLVRRPVATMCGRTLLVYFDGVTGNHDFLDTFDDRDLCSSCRRALGPHAPRAFEHPRPGAAEDGDD